MKIFVNMVLFLSMSLFLQALNYMPVDSIAPGMHFEQGLNWAKILEKAKAENKYIFVDCYTTWCGPCQRMEKEVYSVQKIGDSINDKFISVKLQMDTSKADNNAIKALYMDAHYFGEHYKIRGYPTLLFFNPDGRILKKDLGALGADDFMKCVSDVLDPERDYYRLLISYRQGRRDLTEMGYLARTSLELMEDTALSEEISRSYMHSLKRRSLFLKDNILFMQEFTRSSKDIGFNLFYQYGDTINRIMQDGDYAESLVHSILYKEMIFPEIEKAKKSGPDPNWNLLYLKIKKNYGVYYAKRVILGSKSSWERHQKHWSTYLKYYIRFVENYDFPKGIITTDGMEDLIWNNRAWEVFKYSNNKEELQKALKWSNYALMMNPIPNWMDTYANILYKLNYRDLAITWEVLAAKGAPMDKDIQSDLEKMKKQEPTWPQVKDAD